MVVVLPSSPLAALRSQLSVPSSPFLRALPRTARASAGYSISGVSGGRGATSGGQRSGGYLVQIQERLEAAAEELEWASACRVLGTSGGEVRVPPSMNTKHQTLGLVRRGRV